MIRNKILWTAWLALLLPAGAADLPPFLQDAVEKISNSGPGLKPAQKAEMAQQYQALKSVAAANAVAAFCGRGEAVDSPNRIVVKTASGERVRVRLAWVYAPEEPQSNAAAARLRMTTWTQGYDVCVRATRFAGTGLDNIKRYIGVITLSASSMDVGFELLKQGLAWHWVEFAQNGQDAAQFAQYAAAQHWTRTWRVGIFEQSNPIAPWAFRSTTDTRPISIK